MAMASEAATRGIRVEIDRERCIGSGVCAYHAPGSFDVGDDAKATWIDEGGAPPDAIRAAVENCPTRALRLLEDEEEPK
jgi:ferredoxin